MALVRSSGVTGGMPLGTSCRLCHHCFRRCSVEGVMPRSVRSFLDCFPRVHELDFALPFTLHRILLQAFIDRLGLSGRLNPEHDGEQLPAAPIRLERLYMIAERAVAHH